MSKHKNSSSSIILDSTQEYTVFTLQRLTINALQII